MLFRSVIERDKISEVELGLRDSAAIKYNENQFDFVIKNNYTLEI